MNTVQLTDWEVLAIEIALDSLLKNTDVHRASLESLQEKFYSMAETSWSQGDNLSQPSK